MWICSKCKTRIDGKFDNCWNCGAKRDETSASIPAQDSAVLSSPARPVSRGGAFIKGGFGCLLLFVVTGIVFVVLGGTFHADVGGLVVIFLIGGVISLIVVSIYNKGRKDANAPNAPKKLGDGEP